MSPERRLKSDAATLKKNVCWVRSSFFHFSCTIALIILPTLTALGCTLLLAVASLLLKKPLTAYEPSGVVTLFVA